MVNAPSAPVETVFAIYVPALVAVTFALAMVAPVESATVPTMVPTACDHSGDGMRNARTGKQSRRRRTLRCIIQISQVYAGLAGQECSCVLIEL
jgi:hypothetical protein